MTTDVLAAAGVSTSYASRLGLPGGGFCNVGAFDHQTVGLVACGGDVWGPRLSDNGGVLWRTPMWGMTASPYGRAVVFSKRPTFKGQAYLGAGGLHTGIAGGGFYVMQGYHCRQTSPNGIGFGTQQSTAPDGGNPAGYHPRAVGDQILVDYDRGSDTEYLYACLPGYGLGRCTDNSQGAHWSKMGSVATPSQGLWKGGAILPSGNLLFFTYQTNTTSGTIVYKVTSPRSTASVATVTGGGVPAVVSSVRVDPSTSRVFAACGSHGVMEVTSDGTSWNAVSGNAFFSGYHPSAVAINSVGELFVGTGTPDGAGHGVARSTDHGATWNWIMQSGNLNFAVLGGDGETWWLKGGPDPTSPGYAVAMIEVDPFDDNHVMTFGRSGSWSTVNARASAASVQWNPAMHGQDGCEMQSLGVGSGGSVGGTEADWKVFSSSDYMHHQANTSGPSGGDNKDAAGNTYTFAAGNPGVIKVNGNPLQYASTADSDYASGWLTGDVSGPKVADNGTVYMWRGKGGGVLVLDPGGSVTHIIPPTPGTPTIDDTTPQTGETLTAQPNDSTWGGTKPLTYSFQWQRASVSTGPWTNITGATSSDGKYTTDPTADLGKYLRCHVVGDNSALGTGGGSASANTGATAAVVAPPAAPTNITAPALSSSVASVGAPLTSSKGSWTNTPTGYVGQWQSAATSAGPWTNVGPTGVSSSSSGFANDTYTPQTGDVGKVLRCRVTASNSAGSGNANTSASGTVSNPGVTVTDNITSGDGTTITLSDDYLLTWTATTNAPGGVIASEYQIDGGGFQAGVLVSDDGAGTTTWQADLLGSDLGVGVHTLETRDTVAAP